AAQLHLRARQHDGLAAELPHADIERHPGAGRRPLEDHRKRLAFERLLRLLVRLQPRLEGGARSQHAAQVGQRERADIEEMPRLLAHCPATRFNSPADSATQARSSIAMDSSISASLTINGGRKRTTLSPAPTVSSFCPRNAVTRSAAGTTALTPISRPSPRTSEMMSPWRSMTEASFCLSKSDIFLTRSKKPGLSMTSSTAFAAAIARGLPPKVEPCEPGVIPAAASAVARQAPIGKPPPSALASGMTSGVTPSRL